MNIDADLYSPRFIPLESAQAFVLKTLPQLGWSKTDKDEVILDLGCGSGGTTKELILPLFSSSSRIFAVDIVPDMIAMAKKYNSSPQIDYSLVNIEDWSSLQRFKNQITKLVSISVFQWLKNQRNAFQNVYDLLQNGGEAALFFPLQCTYFSSILYMQNNPKWSHLFDGVENYVPESHDVEYDASHYKTLLEEIGFEVLYCKKEEKIDVFPSEGTYRDFFTSICILRKYVPSERLKEFEDEYMKKLKQYNGYNSKGLPFHKGNFMELVFIKK